jgi:hypothetical protein
MSQLIQKFFNHWHRIFDLCCNCIEVSKINTKTEAVVFFLTERTDKENGLELGWIILDCSISETCRSISSLMAGGYRYDLTLTGPAPGTKGMM